MLKQIVLSQLERKTRRYMKRHKPLLIAVVGSVGKTSTKMALATILSQKFRVRVTEGNLNTRFSTPLSIMGITYPENVRSIKEWRMVFQAMNMRILQPKDVDVIIQELGTDHPGDIAAFGRYLRPNIAVVTAVSPEHMEYFTDIQAVAVEELAVSTYSDALVINTDDVDKQYAQLIQSTDIDTYGLSEHAEYRVMADPVTTLGSRTVYVSGPNWQTPLTTTVPLVGDHSLKAIAAAACVGLRLGMSDSEITAGIQMIQPVPGRMQLLKGIENSLIIDDTYNSSPLAAAAALRALYAIETPQRIAVLGSMNELGEMSRKAHEELGAMCDYNKLDWVVTIGEEAEKYLAPAAKAQGCQVRSFRIPFQAGGFVNSVLHPDGSVILFKGSQNGVFAEEAIKVILEAPEDEKKLVRQDEAWMLKKQEAFNYFTASHEIIEQ